MGDNAAMNRMIVAGARRGERAMPRALAGLACSPPLDTDTPLTERLTRLLDEREAAMQAGDADALAFVEHKLERWDEARAAQKAEEQPPPASFDGGVRQRRPAPTPGFQQESAASLFVRAMQTSKQERAERDADPGHTIIANI
jgi:hypothetical protein